MESKGSCIGWPLSVQWSHPASLREKWISELIGFEDSICHLPWQGQGLLDATPSRLPDLCRAQGLVLTWSLNPQQWNTSAKPDSLHTETQLRHTHSFPMFLSLSLRHTHTHTMHPGVNCCFCFQAEIWKIRREYESSLSLWPERECTCMHPGIHVQQSLEWPLPWMWFPKSETMAY